MLDNLARAAAAVAALFLAIGSIGAVIEVPPSSEEHLSERALVA